MLDVQSGKNSGLAREVTATFGRREAIQDPAWERGFADWLRHSRSREQLAELFAQFRSGESAFDHLMRRVNGKAWTTLVRVLLGITISDIDCGFKLFKREKIRPVFEKLTIWGFGFDPELLFLASRSGLKILEIPVRWSHAEGSKIRFFRDGVRMFTDLVQIRWNSIQGRYS